MNAPASAPPTPVPDAPPPLAGLADLLGDAVLLLDADGTLRYANPAAHALSRQLAPAGELRPGHEVQWLLRLLPDGAVLEATEQGRWEYSTALAAGDGGEITLRIALHGRRDLPPAQRDGSCFAVIRDISAEVRRERELQHRHSELQMAYLRLAGTQEQLLQSEKMASIGQLAAGVAHEINNPIGYVHSNLGTLQEYLRNLITLLDAYDRAVRGGGLPEETVAELDELRARFDLDFVTQDLPDLLAESREGIERVTKIVQDLKDFSYTGRGEAWTETDLHRALDSTLNIVWNEIKYKARVEKRYGSLPPVECLPSEINQVFMNILVNAGQAIVERGVIVIETGHADDEVWVRISDTGKGIPESVLPRIFDPFFTTKPVGHGTGLGLSITYGIVAKHHGRIEVSSVPGEGTAFRIVLPVRQPREAPAG